MPAATRMPAAASCTSADRSLSTGSHRLMPSAGATRHAARAQRVAERALPRVVLRAGPRRPRRSTAPSVSRSSRIVCSIREVQPGPSMRRATIRSMRSRGPPSAAMRRSGPCDFEKLRTCTHPVGQPGAEASRRPRSRSAPEWSSSMTTSVVDVGGRADDARQLLGALGGHRGARSGSARAAAAAPPTGRPCSARGERLGHACRARRARTGTASAPSTSSRSRNGGNPGFSTTTRSPKRTTCSSVREMRVEGAVDDRDRLGRRRPRVARAPSRAPGCTGLGLVAAGLGARPTRATSAGPSAGSSSGSGVPRERSSRTGSSGAAMPRMRGGEPRRRRLPRTKLPGAAARLDQPGRRERLPGLAHGRRADAQLGGELAHRRQPVARRELARAHEPGDDRRRCRAGSCRGIARERESSRMTSITNTDTTIASSRRRDSMIHHSVTE